ncbi:MAG: HAD family phosphatase [Micropruina sp.]|nr:HAD family phosphatase [Micropruina sp.]HBX81488.1 HAD family hydrolase [Propionibacteriaceae bacterium]
MTWRPRLVALDIDGTCVGFDGVMTSGLRDVLVRVQAAGVPVTMVTGRSWHATRPVVDALGLVAGQHVCSNGAVRVAYPPFSILGVRTFDATDVVERVHRTHPRAAMAVEVLGTGYRVTRPFPIGELHGDIEIVEPGALLDGPVTRVIVRDPDANDGEFEAMVASLGLHDVSYFVGWTSWLDIAPTNVDKALGLSEVCADLGIDAADVLAIGDGRNDIELLAWAGRGVALGDAPAIVREAADAVTGTFADGGTVEELERWFPAV